MVLTPRRRDALALTAIVLAVMAALAVALLLSASVAAAGSPSHDAQPCPEGQTPVGDLGIVELSGVARFSLSSSSHDGDRRVQRIVVFSGEPRVVQLAEGSPSSGQLREGDVLVGVDGALITSREGSRRFVNLEPGQPVALQVRRDGRIVQLRLVPALRCGDSPVWLASPEPPTAPTPPLPPDAWRSPEPATTTRTPSTPRAVEVQPVAPATPFAPLAPMPALARWRTASDADADEQHTAALMAQRGWLGVGIDCEGCHWKTLPGDSGLVWASREYPVIYNVDEGSPAAKGGLQRGDVLTHMDGVSLLTPAGARHFGALRPYQRVRWTYRRDGRPGTAVVVAAPRPGPAGEYARSMAGFREQVQRMREDQNKSVEMQRQLAELEAQMTRAEAPRMKRTMDQRLRYSGSVANADVEVKGLGTVVVTTDESTGELVITTNDATVRIRPGTRASKAPRADPAPRPAKPH